MRANALHVSFILAGRARPMKESKRGQQSKGVLAKGGGRNWRWSTIIAIGLSLVVLVYLCLLLHYTVFVSSSSEDSAGSIASHVHSREAMLSSLKAQKQELDQLRQQLLLERQELRQQRKQLQMERMRQDQQQLRVAEELLVRQKHRTIRFQVCNGFGNQRLAVMYAAILAKGTKRALVLPRLIGVGTQFSLAENRGTEGEFVDFGAVYDVDVFKR